MIFLPLYAGMTIESSYRYDERLAILGCFGDPTREQHEIAWREATDFDRETMRRQVAQHEIVLS